MDRWLHIFLEFPYFSLLTNKQAYYIGLCTHIFTFKHLNSGFHFQPCSDPQSHAASSFYARPYCSKVSTSESDHSELYQRQLYNRTPRNLSSRLSYLVFWIKLKKWSFNRDDIANDREKARVLVRMNLKTSTCNNTWRKTIFKN